MVLFGVNLEELLWDGVWGVCGGMLYPLLASHTFARCVREDPASAPVGRAARITYRGDEATL